MSDRLFIFLDEWLWVGLCIYLLSRWAQWSALAMQAHEPLATYQNAQLYKRAFFAAVLIGAVMVYGISYPMLWGWIRP